MRNPGSSRREWPKGIGLVELLVVIGIIGLLLALTLPAVMSSVEASRGARCGSNLRQIGLATQQYVASHGVFPANWGVADFFDKTKLPLRGDMKEYSVFTQILPYLDQRSLFDSINFDLGITDPYFSPERFGRSGLAGNSTVMGVSLAVLLCPSDGGAARWPLSAGTNYRSNNGTERWYLSHDGPFMNDDGFQNGPDAIRDGLSNTTAFSEKLRGSPDLGRVDPRADMIVGGRGLPYSVDESMIACASRPGMPRGSFACGGASWFIGTLSQTNYNHIMGPNNTIPDCVLPIRSTASGLFAARSNHHGGVNLGMADGSVRFVKNAVTKEVWRALGSRDGGEALSLD